MILSMGQNSLKTLPLWAYQGKMICESMVRLHGVKKTNAVEASPRRRHSPHISGGRCYARQTRLDCWSRHDAPDLRHTADEPSGSHDQLFFTLLLFLLE